MASQNWVSLLSPAQNVWSGAGTTLNTATTATISPRPTPNTADYNGFVAAGAFYPGMLIRCTARGFITSTATSTTATWFLASNIGNTGTTYVTLATTAGLATSTTVLTGAQWKLEALIRCTLVATAGTLATQGEMVISQQPSTAQTLNTASTAVNLWLPNASGETAATVDTTQTQGIALRATLAGANATISCTQWVLEALC